MGGKRIGEDGMKLILTASINIHDEQKGTSSNKEEIVYADTTIQEKNITFPTDAKLHQSLVFYVAKRYYFVGF